MQAAGCPTPTACRRDRKCISKQTGYAKAAIRLPQDLWALCPTRRLCTMHKDPKHFLPGNGPSVLVTANCRASRPQSGASCLRRRCRQRFRDSGRRPAFLFRSRFCLSLAHLRQRQTLLPANVSNDCGKLAGSETVPEGGHRTATAVDYVRQILIGPPGSIVSLGTEVGTDSTAETLTVTGLAMSLVYQTSCCCKGRGIACRQRPYGLFDFASLPLLWAHSSVCEEIDYRCRHCGEEDQKSHDACCRKSFSRLLGYLFRRMGFRALPSTAGSSFRLRSSAIRFPRPQLA
jgi:hypothetical protein